MPNFTATITTIPDRMISQVITMEAYISADDATGVGSWYVSLMLYNSTTNASGQVVPSTMVKDGLLPLQSLTQTPQKYDYNYVLPANLAAGKYFVMASVRDTGWHWQHVTQTPMGFNVSPIPIVNGFKYYINPIEPPASAGIVSLITQPDGSHMPPGNWMPVPGMSILDNSVLDTTKWHRKYWLSYGAYDDHLNDEIERYVDSAVDYQNNQFLITATPRTGTTAHAPSPSGNLYPYFDSGMVRSVQTAQYFFSEIDIVFPKQKGIWPAFWMVPGDGKTDPNPEMDMIEFVYNSATETDNMIHTGGRNKNVLIWGDYNYNARYTYLNVAASFYGPDYFVNRSVKVAILWAEDDTITMYHDGTPTAKWSFPWTFMGSPAPPATIMVNFAIGGSWPTGGWMSEVPSGPTVLAVNSLRTFIKTSAKFGPPSPL